MFVLVIDINYSGGGGGGGLRPLVSLYQLLLQTIFYILNYVLIALTGQAETQLKENYKGSRTVLTKDCLQN